MTGVGGRYTSDEWVVTRWYELASIDQYFASPNK